MKKIIIILSILLFCTNLSSPVFSETGDNNYSTEENVQAVDTQVEEEMFAPVDLDLTDYTQMNKENKRFKLSAEKEGKPSYVKNTGQIWSEDKLFLHTYYSDESNLRVLPSYGSLNSFITRQLDPNTTVMIGQDGISSVGGTSLNFFSVNGSLYASGARMEGSTDKLNYSVGAFNETDTTNQFMAAALSSKPKHILNSKGTYSFGAGMITNIKSVENKNTAGIFTQYNRGKFSLGTQFAQSSYSENSKPIANMLHILPQYVVNEHLTLKSKIVKDMDVDEMQGEIGISLRPLKDTDALSFDISATNYQSQNVVTRQRLKFSTSFRF